MYDKASQIEVAAGIVGNGGVRAGMVRKTHYRIECVRGAKILNPDAGLDEPIRYEGGQVIWVEEFDNLVTTEGLNDSLDKHFKGSTYTAAWYVGLTDGTPTFAVGDTMASHAGWVEITAYSEATREVLTLGTVAAGSVDNSASKAIFTINATATVGGAFIVTISTKGGTTGILYGGGAFSQDRALVNLDVLNVTVTLTAANPA